MNYTIELSPEHMQVVWNHLYEGKAKDTFVVLEGIKAQLLVQEKAAMPASTLPTIEADHGQG